MQMFICYSHIKFFSHTTNLIEQVSYIFGQHENYHYRKTQCEIAGRFQDNNCKTDCHTYYTTWNIRQLVSASNIFIIMLQHLNIENLNDQL